MLTITIAKKSCTVSPTRLQEKTLHIAGMLVANYHAGR